MADQDQEWTSWGRRVGFVALKPPSPRQIAKLGDALDRTERLASHAWTGDTGRYSLTPDTMPAERFYALCDRRCRTEAAYVRAINARDLAAKIKLENAKQPPKSGDAFAYRDALYEAAVRLEVIEDAGPNFSTMRERIDARAAADLAERLHDIAHSKFQDAERTARITGTPRRSSRPRARPVVDGFVKTGKFKMIGGNRVPVLEKVE
jgi:hypothetical protein